MTICCRAGQAGPDSGSLIYVKPYCRIAPYLVGMVVGYLLIHSKDWRLPTKVTRSYNITFVFFYASVGSSDNAQTCICLYVMQMIPSGPIIDYQNKFQSHFSHKS